MKRALLTAGITALLLALIGAFVGVAYRFAAWATDQPQLGVVLALMLGGTVFAFLVTVIAFAVHIADDILAKQERAK